MFIEEATAELSTKSGNYYFKCKLRVLAGTVEGQIGKEMQFQGFPGDKMFAIAAAVGLIDAITGTPYTRKDLDKMRTDKKAGHQVRDCDFDEKELVGRHFCAPVVHKKGEEWPEVGFDIWSVFDPEAADIPKDAELMSQLGVVEQPHANGSAGKPAAAAAGAGASKSRFAGNDD